MSDARLTIALDDGTAGGSKLPGGSADADILDRWHKLTEAMGRSVDEATARARRVRSYSPAGASPWSSMDFDAPRRAALGGRPDGVTDAEWAAFGKENARRGAAGAKVAGRAQGRQRADAKRPIGWPRRPSHAFGKSVPTASARPKPHMRPEKP